jgi:hypothetical protein
LDTTSNAGSSCAASVDEAIEKQISQAGKANFIIFVV